MHLLIHLHIYLNNWLRKQAFILLHSESLHTKTDTSDEWLGELKQN